MWKIQLACIAVFAAIGESESGKCNSKYAKPVPIPIKETEKHANWRVIYATDWNSIEDHESYFISARYPGLNYEVSNTKVWKNGARTKYTFGLKYINNVLVEDTVDDNGKRHRYYMNPLAITTSLATLIYRCSDDGDPDVYYRFVAFPVDSEPSESEIQQLLARDRAIFGDSHGYLKKLPESIVN